VSTFQFEQVVKLAGELSHAPTTALAAMSELCDKTAYAIRDRAIADAPVGETGDLKASIGARAVGPYTRIIYSNVRYDVFVEYGTGKMAAQPFMAPAADAEEEKFYLAAEAIAAAAVE
jgi:HK97 gp10 family phage protein